MASGKCVHKGCGKTFTDQDEPCVYHPGPPIFHEGQKGRSCKPNANHNSCFALLPNFPTSAGWKCCKPRVLTFDEFLSIPPCTTGKHSITDDAPALKRNPQAQPDLPLASPKPASDIPTSNIPPAPNTTHKAPSAPTTAPQDPTQSKAPEVDSESDDPTIPVPPNLTCKRRGCNATSEIVAHSSLESNEVKCIYHPGQALFHEGSKGWTCCKKRVLEFDEFMRIPGCKVRHRHCFLGKKTSAADSDVRAGGSGDGSWEMIDFVRHDFYQTPVQVHASFYLKKVDKARSRISFLPCGDKIFLSLWTTDRKKFEAEIPLFGRIDPGRSSSRILGTKVDLMMVKADGNGWPVLRADEKLTGEIIQTGKAGRA